LRGELADTRQRNYTKEYFNVSFFVRLVLGSVFIIAGISKLLNPHVFEKALNNYNLFPNVLINFILISFPWIELFLGGLLISGFLSRYIALVTIILILIFMCLTVISTSNGNSGDCGCFPGLPFLNSNNPFILIMRNFLLLALAVIILVGKRVPKLLTHISNKKHVYSLCWILIVIYLASLMFVLIAKRVHEKKYFSIVSNTRIQLINELENLDNKYIGRDINNICDIAFPKEHNAKIFVMLTLSSFDCGNCVDEAVFLEYLNRKYGENICFFAVVGKFGHTAINNFKNTFSITYPFIQDPRIFDSEIFSKYKALKTIISDKNEILRIDPVTFNVKKFRNEYENILLTYLK